MTREDTLALARKAGLLPSEMRDDPVHGLVITAAGMRKIAALAPDQERARQVLKAAGAGVGSVLNVDDRDSP